MNNPPGQPVHEKYMLRCLELAKLGAGRVAPNPMVGAVLVYGDRIIGEGYHQTYGNNHAEVNCLRSVKAEDQQFIPNSRLYVSLEPCVHFGKTPPCTELIIKNRIPEVIIGSTDPNKLVNGKGIEKLQQAGINVTQGIQEEASGWLNRRFFTFHSHHRPYVILKWAQTADGKIAGEGSGRTMISGEESGRLVHRWRSEEASILVGTNTALLDDPELTNRLWPGPTPVRIVIDMNLRLPASIKLLQGRGRTIVFNKSRQDDDPDTTFIKVLGERPIIEEILQSMYNLQIQSVLVEGGAAILRSFIEAGTWDEARVITNEKLIVGKGLAAPILSGARLITEEKAGSDRIEYFIPAPKN